MIGDHAVAKNNYGCCCSHCGKKILPEQYATPVAGAGVMHLGCYKDSRYVWRNPMSQVEAERYADEIERITREGV